MNYSIVLIEMLTALLGILLVLVRLSLPREKRKVIAYISTFGLLLILAATIFISKNTSGTFIHGMYISDPLSIFFKQLFLTAAILVTLMSMGYIKRFPHNRGEFFAINVFALLGMMVIASSNDFISLFLGIELMALSFVILSAYEKNFKSSEAGMKYMLLNAMSSAMLLYGISLLYGLSGSPLFADTVNYLQAGHNSPLAALAILMVISGLGFKISIVPFHMWSPDVYEGAPTPVTAFLAIGSKVAAFAVLIRLFIQVFPPVYNVFALVIIALSALTMVIGNLIAIPQSDFKRLLAYSSIAQAGYILLGIVAHNQAGISAMLFYLVLYIFTNAGAFAVIIACSNQTGNNQISSLRGMWKRSPLAAAVLLLSFLSLAGIPPAAGFIGKFYLFAAIIKQGYLWLAFLAIGMSMVSVYYYIAVIKALIMEDNENEKPIIISSALKVVMIVSLIMVLFMGIYPGPITEWTSRAASHLIK